MLCPLLFFQILVLPHHTIVFPTITSFLLLLLCVERVCWHIQSTHTSLPDIYQLHTFANLSNPLSVYESIK